MKRALCLILAFAVCAAIWATGEGLTFVWDWNDFSVTGYRYQLDSTEGEWTWQDYYLTSATFYDLDLSVPHTLYIQQTYDGQIWSETAELTYYPAEESEILPGQGLSFDESDAAIQTQEPGTETPEAESDAALEFEVQLEPEEPARTRGPIEIGAFAEIQSAVAKTTKKAIRTGLNLEFGDLSELALGMVLDAGTELYAVIHPYGPFELEAVGITGYALAEYPLTEKLSVGAVAGLEAALDFTSGNRRFGFGLTLGVMMGFRPTSSLRLEGRGTFHILTTGVCFSGGVAFGLEF